MGLFKPRPSESWLSSAPPQSTQVPYDVGSSASPFTDRLRGVWQGSKNLLEPLTTGVSQFGQHGGSQDSQVMQSLMPLLMLLQMVEGE